MRDCRRTSCRCRSWLSVLDGPRLDPVGRDRSRGAIEAHAPGLPARPPCRSTQYSFGSSPGRTAMSPREVSDAWFQRIWNEGDMAAVDELASPAARFHGLPSSHE